MDIGADMANPWGINDKGEKYRDLVRYESGKYLYRMPDGELEIDRFNRDFDQYRQRTRETMRKNIEQINANFQEQLQEPVQDPVNDNTINEPVNKNKYLWIILILIFFVFLIIVLSG